VSSEQFKPLETLLVAVQSLQSLAQILCPNHGNLRLPTPEVDIPVNNLKQVILLYRQDGGEFLVLHFRVWSNLF
jgi:hypothetical protein